MYILKVNVNKWYLQDISSAFYLGIASQTCLYSGNGLEI